MLLKDSLQGVIVFSSCMDFSGLGQSIIGMSVLEAGC